MFPVIISTTSAGIELRFDLPEEQRHRRNLYISCSLIGILCLAMSSFLVVVAAFEWPVILLSLFVVWAAVAGSYVAATFTYRQHGENNPILKWDQGKRRIELKGQAIPQESCQLVLLEGLIDIDLLKVQLQLIDTSSSASRVFVLLRQFQKPSSSLVRVVEQFATATGCQFVRHTIR